MPDPRTPPAALLHVLGGTAHAARHILAASHDAPGRKTHDWHAAIARARRALGAVTLSATNIRAPSIILLAGSYPCAAHSSRPCTPRKYTPAPRSACRCEALNGLKICAPETWGRAPACCALTQLWCGPMTTLRAAPQTLTLALPNTVLSSSVGASSRGWSLGGPYIVPNCTCAHGWRPPMLSLSASPLHFALCVATLWQCGRFVLPNLLIACALFRPNM